MAESKGAGPVALIDTDPQGSLSSWWNKRQADTPLCATVDIAKLSDHLKEIKNAGIKLAIINTPPAVTDIIAKVLAEADLVLIPTRPSPHDLRAVWSTAELVQAAGKRMVFVINGAVPRARITAAVAIALSQHGTVAPVTIFQRTDLAASMIDGRTVQEIDATSRSAEEIEKIWITYLRNYVNYNHYSCADCAV